MGRSGIGKSEMLQKPTLLIHVSGTFLFTKPGRFTESVPPCVFQVENVFLLNCFYGTVKGDHKKGLSFQELPPKEPGEPQPSQAGPSGKLSFHELHPSGA